MEIAVESRPVYLIALSERELRNALVDPTHLQTMMRRKLVGGDDLPTLALPAPRKKLRAGKAAKAVAMGEHKCDVCGKPFKLAGFLRNHKAKEHGGDSNG